MGGRTFSVHAEGERVILTRAQGTREEVALVPPVAANSATPPPADGSNGSVPVAPLVSEAVVAANAEAEPPAVKLPQPLCPQGVVTTQLDEAENQPPPTPGTSPLDEHFPIHAPAPQNEAPAVAPAQGGVA